MGRYASRALINMGLSSSYKKRIHIAICFTTHLSLFFALLFNISFANHSKNTINKYHLYSGVSMMKISSIHSEFFFILTSEILRYFFILTGLSITRWFTYSQVLPLSLFLCSKWSIHQPITVPYTLSLPPFIFPLSSLHSWSCPLSGQLEKPRERTKSREHHSPSGLPLLSTISAVRESERAREMERVPPPLSLCSFIFLSEMGLLCPLAPGAEDGNQREERRDQCDSEAPSCLFFLFPCSLASKERSWR